MAGVDEHAVTENIEALIGKGDYMFTEGFSYTPRSKKILEMSIAISRQMKQNYVGTEHILYALVSEKEGVAFKILSEIGVDVNEIENGIIKAAGDNMQQAAGTNNKSETPKLDSFGIDLTQAAKGRGT